MRIAIDARYLKAEYSGISAYSENLIQALAAEDHENEYIVVQHSSYRGDLRLPENFKVIEDNARPVSFRTLTSLQNLLHRHNAAALHSLFPLVPMLWNGKLVATVHDLQPLLDPLFTGGRGRAKKVAYDTFYKIAYPMSLRKADYLISVSFATKESMAELMPDVAGRTLVVHQGIAEDAYAKPTEEQVERVQEDFGIPDRFIFYLGSTRPNKNLMNMIDAFDRFMKKHPEHDDLHFVMVLKQDRFFEALFARIRERGLLRHIHIHEQVTEIEKRVFYSLASLLFFVTKFEGFGLPVLEAQAQGLPVLAADHGALPEVGGRGALYCNPDEPDDIVRALAEMFESDEVRTRLQSEGYENVKRFSWKRAASEILDLYNHLLT